MAFTITSALRWWATEMPDQIAIKVEERAYSYRQIHQLSLEVGAGLIEKGVKPGDRICVIAANSLDYCLLILAGIQVGAIMTPLNFRLTQTETLGAFNDFTPSLIFADADRLAVAKAAAARYANIEVLDVNDIQPLRRAPTQPFHEAQRDDPVGIISTSGSTAKAKGAVHTHYTVVTYACEFALMEPRCARGSRILLVTPLSASSGFTLVLEFITLGVSIFMEPSFDAQRALDILAREKINNFQGVPTFFERIATLAQFKDADLSDLHFSQVGGAAVSEDLLQAWLAKGVTLRHLYGQTEAGGGWAARDATALTQREKCGRGGIFTEYGIYGEDGFNPAGKVGEIVVRGPSQMIGYWNNEDATKEALQNGWLFTGDMGSLDEDGNLTFSHRKKDIIISGGLNISSAEIERVLLTIPGIEEAAVIPTPDAAFGETPLAIIYTNDDTITEDSVIAHCNLHLANFKVPRYVVLQREPLPRLLTGKLAKPALKEHYKDAAQRLRRVR
ncbi:MAG TPA: AMP-binding protein [Rhizomicrobium sp.]|nr:AMP-binding protein [Rhizomicrobium sp.]